jgi:hypothetical protein
MLSDEAIGLLQLAMDRRRQSNSTESGGLFYSTQGLGGQEVKEMSSEEAVFYPVGSELWLDCLPGSLVDPKLSFSA